ncbi:unnamed protein product [Meloidogyne enterolobii]|uniref:Uncharacterized protein n=1 Tax=Meloidogyne enterolobii TaxID=390850 RepID=A0ACB0XZE5_MELEN
MGGEGDLPSFAIFFLLILSILSLMRACDKAYSSIGIFLFLSVSFLFKYPFFCLVLADIFCSKIWSFCSLSLFSSSSMPRTFLLLKLSTSSVFLFTGVIRMGGGEDEELNGAF